MKKILEKLKKKIVKRFRFKSKKGEIVTIILVGISLLAALGVVFVPAIRNLALKGVTLIAAKVIEGISIVIVWLLGIFITAIVQVIVGVAQYNDFTTTDAVIKGWGILRDIANMFFIIMFLVMAFGTIIKKEQYSYKKLLLPLILMAVFVNFSLAICGLVIDFSQVIMLTFVNAFKNIAGGNLIEMLGVSDLIKIENAGTEGAAISPEAIPEGIGDLERAGVYMMAAIMSFIALIVLAIVAIILILRIIALWFLVVLSPLAFIFYVIPGTQQYAKQWQNKFVNQVIIGPVLAFFLWFSFFVVQTANKNTVLNIEPKTGQIPLIAHPALYAGFILGCGMLIGALVAAKQLGVVGASLAGKGMNFLQKTGTAAAKKVGRAATYFPREFGKKVGYGAADLGLRSLLGVPIVGRMAGKKLGELRAKRGFEEEKAARPYQYLQDHEMGQLLRGTLRGTAREGRGGGFFRFFQTEAGRKFELALSKQAWQKKQDWGDMGQSIGISREDLAQRAGEADDVYAARVHPHWDEIRNGPIRQLIERYAQLTGHRRTPENNDIARDMPSWMAYENWRFSNLHLIPDNMERTDPTTEIRFPGMGGYEHTYGVSRQTAAQRAAESNQPYATDPIRGTQIIENRIRNTLEGINARAAADIIPDERQMQFLFRDIQAGLSTGPTERIIAQSNAMRGVDPALLDQPFQYRAMETPPVPPGAPPGTLPGPRVPVSRTISVRGALAQARTAPSYSDHQAKEEFYANKEKYGRTKELHEELGEDYITHPEYLKNKENYLNLKKFHKMEDSEKSGKLEEEERAFKEIQHTESTNETGANLTTNKDVITGVNRTIDYAQEAKGKGAASYKAARIGIDYDKLDFKKAGIDESFKEAPGIGVMGKAKEEIINQVAEILKSQGKSQEEVDQFKESANMAGVLNLYKKGIGMTEAKYVTAHEKVHGIFDSVSPEAKKKVWDTLDEKEKSEEYTRFEKNYGRKPRNEEEVIEEHLVEGVTNETRWAKRDEKGNKIGVQLKDKEKEALAAATGLTITDLTSSLTGRPMIRGAEDKFSLPQVVKAAQGGSSEGLTPEFLTAAIKLTDELKRAAGGLATVGKLGGSIKDLQNTISATATKTGMDNMRMAWVVRENTATWKKASDSLAGLEKKYQQE